MRNQRSRKKPAPRRIEPKSTFGLYIPADLPKEACDFLNVLKDNGSFSNDVMEIIVQYLEIRKILDPTDRLEGVSGNLPDQIQSLIQHTHEASFVSDEPDTQLEELPVSAIQPDEEQKTAGPGFDLNKMLQRMKRNKQLGAVNHMHK